jgi:hypothetical protein
MDAQPPVVAYALPGRVIVHTIHSFTYLSPEQARALAEELQREANKAEIMKV